MEKNGTAGHATDDNIVHEGYILGNYGYTHTHTHTVCNNYAFPL